METRKQNKGVMLRSSETPEKFTFGEMCEYLEALQNQQFSDFKTSSEAMEVDTFTFTFQSRIDWSLAQLAELKDDLDSAFYARSYNSNNRNVDVVDVVYDENTPTGIEVYVSTSEGQSNNANWAFTTSNNCNFFAPSALGWYNSPSYHVQVNSNNTPVTNPLPIVCVAYESFLNSNANPIYQKTFYSSSNYVFYVNISSLTASILATNSFSQYYQRGVHPNDPPLLFSLHAQVFQTWNHHAMNDWMCRMILFFNTVIPQERDLISSDIESPNGCFNNNTFCGVYHDVTFKTGVPVSYSY